MYGYMSENMILCPIAYSGSTDLVSEAALETNAAKTYRQLVISLEKIACKYIYKHRLNPCLHILLCMHVVNPNHGLQSSTFFIN